MKLRDVGSVIAARELLLDSSEKVLVLIGKPQRMPDGPDWYCPYQKQGVGSGRVFYGAGVDEVQALIHALSMVGAELYTCDEYKDGRLTWGSGAARGDLGFPVPENIRGVLPGGEGTNKSQ